VRAFPPIFQAVSCTSLLFRILFDELTACQRKDGIAKIDIDNAYVRQHGYDSTFDELVVKVIAGTDVRHGEFLEPLQRLMVGPFPSHHSCRAAPFIIRRCFSPKIRLKLQNLAPKHLRCLVILRLPSRSMRNFLVLPLAVLCESMHSL
jgi:hypothetical protein